MAGCLGSIMSGTVDVKYQEMVDESVPEESQKSMPSSEDEVLSNFVLYMFDLIEYLNVNAGICTTSCLILSFYFLAFVGGCS